MSTLDDTLCTLIALLDARLYEINVTNAEGIAAMRQGERNQAIGTLLPLERELKVAAGLLDAILALHRTPAAALPLGGV
jgi:hypothetical protein